MTPAKTILVIFVSMLPIDSYAFPEIPFCPAGGPPGWLNHFNYNREQNIWRAQHRRYQYYPIQRNIDNYNIRSFNQGVNPRRNTINTPYYMKQPYASAPYKR